VIDAKQRSLEISPESWHRMVIEEITGVTIRANKHHLSTINGLHHQHSGFLLSEALTNRSTQLSTAKHSPHHHLITVKKPRKRGFD
jgi:hypothetical protein